MKHASANKPKLSWQAIQKLPVKIFLTPAGAFIGYVGKSTKDVVYLHAPGQLPLLPTTRRVFTTVAFGTGVLEIHRGNICATSGVAEVVAEEFARWAANEFGPKTLAASSVPVNQEPVFDPNVRWPEVIGPGRVESSTGQAPLDSLTKRMLDTRGHVDQPTIDDAQRQLDEGLYDLGKPT